jgi:hypothetical protein
LWCHNALWSGEKVHISKDQKQKNQLELWHTYHLCQNTTAPPRCPPDDAL